MSACLSAGESLTPSPVMATTSSCLQGVDQPELLLGADPGEHGGVRATSHRALSSVSSASSRPATAWCGVSGGRDAELGGDGAAR